MIHFKRIFFIPCHTQGYEIVTALQAHLLAECNFQHLTRLYALQKRLFKHRVRSRDLHALDVFDGKSKDRCRKILTDFHLHMHREFVAL